MADTKHTPGFVNLDYIVKNVQVDLDDTTNHKYQKILQLAIRAVTQINMFAVHDVRVVYLKPNSALAVQLPDDFMKISKIGTSAGGTFRNIQVVNDLLLNRQLDDCGEPINTNDQDCNAGLVTYPTFGYYFAPHFRGGRYVGELYGASGGNDLKCRLDLERRQIILNTGVVESTSPINEIVLEYKSSGITASGETIIPRQAVETILAFCHWKLIDHKPKMSVSEKSYKKQEYLMQFEALKRYENSFSVEDYYDTIYGTYKSGPKR